MAMVMMVIEVDLIIFFFLLKVCGFIVNVENYERNVREESTKNIIIMFE